MKKGYQLILAFSILQLTVTPLFAQKKKDKEKDKAEITIEEVAERCKGIPSADKVTIRVARFNVSTNKAGGEFGQEMATMLTAAIQQTSCFRVLETNRNMSDMTGEIGVGQQGFTDGSGPEAGQLLGAQLVATGEVTEYAKGGSSNTFGGIVTVGKEKATIGFIIKLLNPQTGEVLFTKAVNAKGESSSKSTFAVPGYRQNSNDGDRAVSNAMEKGIIQAVQLMIDAKETIEIPKPIKIEEAKKYNFSNCGMLQNGGGPKIMILVPEAQSQGATTGRDNLDRRTQAEIEAEDRKADRELTRDVFRSLFGNNNNNNSSSDNNNQSKRSSNAIYKPVVVEQAVAETEIIQKFIEAGFRVIDAKMAKQMRQKMDSLSSNDDLAQLASVAQKLGVNVIITGFALSEPVGNRNGMVTYRGTIELRAVVTDDATILASNTTNAGGADVADAVASKIALKNASGKISNYMLEQLCNRNISFKDAGSSGNAQKSGSPASAGGTEIMLSGITFSQMQSLESYLKSNSKIKEVKKTFAANTGRLTVSHSLTTDQVADLLANCKSLTIEIVSMNEARIEAKVK
jgi:curli biogenesis system outer membrane secretion channel CsgG